MWFQSHLEGLELRPRLTKGQGVGLYTFTKVPTGSPQNGQSAGEGEYTREKSETEELADRKEAKGPSDRDIGLWSGCGLGALIGRTLKTRQRSLDFIYWYLTAMLGFFTMKVTWGSLYEVKTKHTVTLSTLKLDPKTDLDENLTKTFSIWQVMEIMHLIIMSYMVRRYTLPLFLVKAILLHIETKHTLCISVKQAHQK